TSSSSPCLTQLSRRSLFRIRSAYAASVQAPPRYPGKVFGLTFDKLLIVAVIAAFVIGPERLPAYAAKLGSMVRSLRDFANGAKDRMRDEMGPEFDEVDWKKLDPRQYD